MIFVLLVNLSCQLVLSVLWSCLAFKKMREIEIYDPEKQQTYELNVLDETYEEIIERGNMHLAATLLQRQQEKENFIAAYNLIHEPDPTNEPLSHKEQSQTNMTTTEVESTTETNTPGELTVPEKLWSDEAVKLLITLCKKYDKEFETGVKKYVWNKIATELTEKCNLLYTPQQCDSKFKCLKNMYKQVKKHNDQSGNNIKVWKYYDLMDDILFSKPEINAEATCSSRTGLTVKGKPIKNFEEITSVQGNVLQENGNEGTPTFKSTFMTKRKLTENAIERRHKEKIARQDRYLDLLERLTTAVENGVRRDDTC